MLYIALFVACDSRHENPKDDYITRSVVSFGNPSRMYRALQKAQYSSSFTIGAIGGSITQGAWASSEDKRYLAHVVSWWQTNFPNVQINLVNAGLSATKSDYGALRAERDLLYAAPDLVIVEFGVNGGNSLYYSQTYEGLIRKIYSMENEPAVILLFMTNDRGINWQEQQSEIGYYYGIPMVSYRDALRVLMDSGQVTWADVSPDHIHPNDRGHYYTGGLLQNMLNHFKDLFIIEETRPEIPALPPPLFSDKYQYTSLFEAGELVPVENSGWTLEAAPLGGTCWHGNTPGGRITFQMQGEALLLSYIKDHADMGTISVTVDDRSWSTHDGWFEETWGSYRNTVLIADDLENATHTVAITLLNVPNDFSMGNEFYILSLGSAGVR